LADNDPTTSEPRARLTSVLTRSDDGHTASLVLVVRARQRVRGSSPNAVAHRAPVLT